MGTDIYAVFRKKNKDVWEDIPSAWDQGRDYDLFYWLAGIRKFGAKTKRICEPRGLPEDFECFDIGNCDSCHTVSSPEIMGAVSELVHEDLTYWMGGHSHSWLTADEMIAAKRDNEFDYFIDELKRLKDLHGDVRMVFGFD